MGLKLYFIVMKEEVKLVENLIDSTEDTTTWELPITIKLKEQKCQILANVNWETKEIISVEEEYEVSYYVSTTKKENIKKENQSFLKKVSRNTRTNPIIKPNDLYLAEIKWELLCASLEIGKYPLLIGPKGGGKTTTAGDLAKA